MGVLRTEIKLSNVGLDARLTRVHEAGSGGPGSEESLVKLNKTALPDYL